MFYIIENQNMIYLKNQKNQAILALAELQVFFLAKKNIQKDRKLR